MRGFFMKDEQKRNLLINISLMVKGDWMKMYEIISDIENYVEQHPEVMDYEPPKMNCKIVTCFDPEYPSHLQSIWHPPLVLYYYGDLSLIQNVDNNLSIVGTRQPSDYGINSTTKVVEALPKEINIVSGGASGIDTIAHTEALRNGHKTICVLGNGIDFVFPKENLLLFEKIKKKGLLISEYPNLTPPTKTSFPIRNRIVSAFSKAILVAEGYKRSGTLVTATHALDQGKLIMAFPYRNDDESGYVCNMLIKQGAFLVSSAKEVYEIFK